MHALQTGNYISKSNSLNHSQNITIKYNIQPTNTIIYNINDIRGSMEQRQEPIKKQASQSYSEIYFRDVLTFKR